MPAKDRQTSDSPGSGQYDTCSERDSVISCTPECKEEYIGIVVSFRKTNCRRISFVQRPDSGALSLTQ
jgi:hypothetical protein